jgi:hypothetical protein
VLTKRHITARQFLSEQKSIVNAASLLQRKNPRQKPLVSVIGFGQDSTKWYILCVRVDVRVRQQFADGIRKMPLILKNSGN